MTDPKHRLRKAMLAAGYKTPTDAAESLRSVNKNTLTSHLNGNRALSRQAAEKYEKMFNVSAAWLLYGDKETFNNPPLRLMVDAGNIFARQGQMPDEAEPWMKASNLLKGDCGRPVVDSGSMTGVVPATGLEATGVRLWRLRRALGKSQAEWAEIVGVKPPSLTNIEKGRNNISVANAIRVSRYTGVTLDWIYTGNETLLPVEIERAMDALSDDGGGWTDGRKR